VWRDSWFPRISYGKILTPRRNKRIKCVYELIDEKGNWNVHKVRDTFFPINVDAILRIKLPRQNHDDVIAWLPDHSGNFFCKIYE
jgi:hypothetical protein